MPRNSFSKNKRFVVIMSGYTATGKSTIARKIVSGVPKTEIFHSAVIRKELGLTPKTKEEADKFFDYRNNLRNEVDKTIYKKLAENARISLVEGKNVVLDAGYFFKWQRELVYESVRDLHPEIIIVRAVCDDENEIKKRIKRRGEKFGESTFNETPSLNTYFATREITEPLDSDSFKELNVINFNTLNKKLRIIIDSGASNLDKIMEVIR